MVAGILHFSETLHTSPKDRTVFALHTSTTTVTGSSWVSAHSTRHRDTLQMWSQPEDDFNSQIVSAGSSHSFAREVLHSEVFIFALMRLLGYLRKMDSHLKRKTASFGRKVMRFLSFPSVLSFFSLMFPWPRVFCRVAQDTHPHKEGDASGYALLWEEMDRSWDKKRRGAWNLCSQYRLNVILCYILMITNVCTHTG